VSARLGRNFEGRSTIETIGLRGAGPIQSESGSQLNRRMVDTGTTVVEEFDETGSVLCYATI
jgi:hypothetical protein